MWGGEGGEGGYMPVVRASQPPPSPPSLPSPLLFMACDLSLSLSIPFLFVTLSLALYGFTFKATAPPTTSKHWRLPFLVKSFGTLKRGSEKQEIWIEMLDDSGFLSSLPSPLLFMACVLSLPLFFPFLLVPLSLALFGFTFKATAPPTTSKLWRLPFLVKSFGTLKRGSEKQEIWIEMLDDSVFLSSLPSPLLFMACVLSLPLFFPFLLVPLSLALYGFTFKATAPPTTSKHWRLPFLVKSFGTLKRGSEKQEIWIEMLDDSGFLSSLPSPLLFLACVLSLPLFFPFLLVSLSLAFYGFTFKATAPPTSSKLWRLPFFVKSFGMLKCGNEKLELRIEVLDDSGFLSCKSYLWVGLFMDLLSM